MPCVYSQTGSRWPVTNIYCAGRNYTDHVQELGNPIIDEPLFFMKATSVLSTQPVVYFPQNPIIHHELEIVVYLSTGGYKIAADEALQHVGGLALGIDFTDRDLQTIFKQKGYPWLLAKSFTNAAWVTPFHSPEWKKWSQEFWLKINGEIVQKSSLDTMLFSISQLIDYLSHRIPLITGDIIFTGTPAGVGPVKIGDQLVLGLGNETLGQLAIEKME